MRRVALLGLVLPTVLWSPGCAGASMSAANVAARESALLTGPEPTGVDPREALASSQLSNGDAEGALRLAREVLAESPRRPRARAVLALALLAETDAATPAPLALQAEAEGQSLLAERLAPADPVVGVLRARVLARIGHLSAAAASAEACLGRTFTSDAPEYVDLLAEAASMCHELGEDRRARKWLGELARRRPRDPDAHYRLGTCLLRSATTADEASQAVREFRLALEIMPADAECKHALVAALLRSSQAHAKEGKGVEAAAQLSAAAEFAAATAQVETTSARAAFDAGFAYETLGNLQLAEDHYAEAVRRDPEHLPSLLNRIAIAMRAREAQGEGAAVAVRGPEPEALVDLALAIDARSGGLEPGERRKLEALCGKK